MTSNKHQFNGVFFFSTADPFFSIPETPCGVVVTSNYTLRLPLVALTQQYAPNFVSKI